MHRVSQGMVTPGLCSGVDSHQLTGSDYVRLFLARHSITSHWEHEIDHGENIYTMETGRYFKSRLAFRNAGCWDIYYHQKHKRQQVLPQNPPLGKWEKLSSDASGDHVLCGSKSECYSSCTTNTGTTPCLCFLSAYNEPSIILSILYHVLYNVILTTILWGQYHSSTLKGKRRHPRMM